MNSEETGKTTSMEWAIAYAKAGLYIIELDKGAKTPVSDRSWKALATNNPDTVKKMFEDTPDANWGVCPGPKFMWLDLDIGDDKDGIEELAVLELENDDIIDSFKCKTPSGGVHVLLRVDEACTNSNSFPNGIDVRGGHGYVVGPGSELIEGLCKDTDTPGLYEHLEGSLDNIAKAPGWVVDHLRSPGQDDPNHDVPLCELDQDQNISIAKQFLKDRDPAIMGQSGDTWTVLTAAFLRDFGVSEEIALQLMVETGWNESCEPCWDVDELALKIYNGYRHSENRPGCKRDKMFDFAEMREKNKLSREELKEKFEMSPLERMSREKDIEESEEKNRRKRFYKSGGFMNRGRRREYVVPGWLPSHGLTALLASRGVGKSTIMLDFACCVAHGLPWQGLPTMAEPQHGQDWKVVYLCGEDDEGLELNLIGWHEHYKREPTDNLIICDGITNLMSEENVVDEIKLIREEVGDSRVIILYDTWQRATYMGRQNDDAEMNKAVMTAEIMAREFNGPAIIAFHPPKDGRQTILGSSFIENATSAIWHLAEEADGLKLKVTRIKGPGHGNWRKFRKHVITLSTRDVFGELETALMPIKFAGTEEAASEDSISNVKKTRLAWAWAIRGCYEFPQFNNNLEPLKKLNGPSIANMVAEMDKTSEINKESESFCEGYLLPLYRQKIVELTGLSSGPYGDDSRDGTVYKALQEEFLNDKADSTPVNFADDADTRLEIVIPKGRTKKVFIITDAESRGEKG